MSMRMLKAGDRLTRRMCGGWGVVEGCELNTVRGMRRVVERLAAYENTELTPEEVNRLKEYMQPFTIQDMDRFREIMQAEKEGRLLVLPFKPGTEYFGHCHVRNANPISTGRFYPPYIPTLGVDAWLTREEAEAALKEQEG